MLAFENEFERWRRNDVTKSGILYDVRFQSPLIAGPKIGARIYITNKAILKAKVSGETITQHLGYLPLVCVTLVLAIDRHPIFIW